VAPPPPHPHPAAGQASLEYVGLLALVAMAIAVAAPAAGLAGVPAEVSRVVRTGVCIVGGDICRPSDAAAAGLDPCTLSDERRGGGLAVTILSVRIGGDHQWLVARRSDGTVAVTKVARDDAAASGGLGYELGPLKAGIEAQAGLRVASGIGWEFPDAATARRFLAAAHYGLSPAIRRWPAAWRSGEAGLAVRGWAGLGVVATGEDGASRGNGEGASLEAPAAGIEVAAGSALGARIARGLTTLYLRAETEGPRTTGLFDGLLDAGRRGPVVAEYTRDRSGPRELAFRTSAPGAREREVVETVARLDLRVPANRAVAARLLRHRAPWPPSVAATLRGAVRRAVRVGTVERSVYAVEDGSRSLELAARAGAEVGLEAGYSRVDRRLVEASAWTAGSKERAREDCMGTHRAHPTGA
jgi:phosphoglycolate phosphatase-like HAD superfamily hydrolase